MTAVPSAAAAGKLHFLGPFVVCAFHALPCTASPMGLYVREAGHVLPRPRGSGSVPGFPKVTRSPAGRCQYSASTIARCRQEHQEEEEHKNIDNLLNCFDLLLWPP